MNKRTSLMDKTVKLNTSMCLWEMNVAGLMAIVIYGQIINVIGGNFIFYASLYSGIMMLVVFMYLSMAVFLAAVIKLYSKLYYRSVFGDTSYLYMPIPFNSFELVIGKVIAGTVTLLVPCLLVLIIVFIKGDMPGLIIGLSEVANVPKGSMPQFTVLMLWDMAFRAFQLNTEVFLAIVFMESLNISDMKIIKSISFALVIFGFEMIKLIPYKLLTLETYPIITLTIDMIMVIVMVVVSVYILTRYFDNKYDLN